jgi:hypothetical protein
MARNSGISIKLPLKDKPVRASGESLDEEIARRRNECLFEYFFAATMESVGYLTRAPRRPVPLSIVAAVTVAVAAWRIRNVRKRVRQLRQGRDGERAVGQFLEHLREGGGQVFHDVPGEGFNLDHVVMSSHGLYAIETKSWSKPWPKATITVEGDMLRVAGRIPDCDPIKQVTAAARWLECLLAKFTGKRFAIRGVLIFPVWFVE